mmetsp:Transcript_31693/g.97015  ORF Transcript_31693/g.97015 Transcript_31693/m.97015 type:complete len:188 (+) Transcript_31693:45-608(+)
MAEGDSSVLDRCWALRKTRAATTLLKFFSVGGGLFLIVAGVIGLTGILYGDLVYFVGSIYAIIFGCTVLVVELRDKVPLVSAAYQLIDVYLKFMTLQRGKGLFYLGIGLLVLYIAPSGTSSWGLDNIAALFLAIIGFSHTFKIIAEVDPILGPGATQALDPGPEFSTARTEWGNMVAQSNNNKAGQR